MSCGEKNTFRANGSTIANPGFITVYQEGMDDKKGDDDDGKLLPPLNEGDIIPLNEIIPNQHFTEPPPRFTEASLVKSLEEHGIGRPSTYASIIYTLKSRDYVVLESKRFTPTDIGRIVNKFLTQYFTQYVDYGFTANLEDQLDAISRGEDEWVPMLDKFWTPFHTLCEKIQETVQRSDVTHEALDETCPKCNENQLSIRLGRGGRFVGCDGYPECNYTRSLDGEVTSEPQVVEDRKCPKCESDLVIKHGRYGKFIGCGAYPKCKHMEPIEKPKDTNVKCAECKEGNMLARKSRYGKLFYSCEKYPECKYAVWNEPVDESCPKCKWPILTIKTTKRRGTEKVCPQKECDHAESFDVEDKENKDD